MRRITAEIRDLPASDATRWCSQQPRNVMGRLSVPSECDDAQGTWLVPDSRCLGVPPPPPQPGGTGSLLSTAPLEGFADLHVHQMANLGFGGTIVWGDAFGDPATALSPIPREYKRGHDTVEEAVTAPAWHTLVNSFLGHFFTHGEAGWPDFTAWPSHRMWTHQQAYVDWLFRSYQGGLRLMVMLAANSEDMFGRGENQLPLIGGRRFQKALLPGRTGNDMEALEWQVRAAYRMQDELDRRAGGPGAGWYRIVRDPEEAAAVIEQGKLAVILGTELQHLFNCDLDRPACTEQTVVDGLNRLEAMGVNHVFPIHHKQNQFGTPAMFQPLNTGPATRCPDLDHKCASKGLTDLGRFVVRELTARGMLIETEHLSRASFGDVMAIVEPLHYPVLAGHVVPLDLQTDKGQQTERAKTSEEIRRIFGVGGIVAPILSASANEYSPDGSTIRVPIRCDGVDKNSGGSDQWANAYLLLRDLARESGSPVGSVAFGTDWNGFAGWPGPRHAAKDRCVPRESRTGQPMSREPAIAYPITLPELLAPAAANPVTSLDTFEWPADARTWNYNEAGASHAGMLPDFIQNLRQFGLTLADLEPLYRSARGVVDLWKNAREREVPGDRRHLRWVEQSPFDLMAFDYWDPSRDVNDASGRPICRSRSGHQLGYVLDNTCRTIEASAPAGSQQAAGPITAYHAGRCLDLKGGSRQRAASATQRTCTNTNGQRWTLKPVAKDEYQISNTGTGLCLGVDKSARAAGARVIQEECRPIDGQVWKTTRLGNTFSLTARHSGLCMEVRDQSRDEDARVQQSLCSGAANQQWTIDALREQDYERLYQADRHRVTWTVSESAGSPIPVSADGTKSICRSPAAQIVLGVVDDGECAGQTVSGGRARSAQFEVLYQSH